MIEILKLHERFCQHSLVFKGNTPRTIYWFKTDIKWFLKFANDIEKIEELTRHRIEDWILHGKLERNWSAQTIKLRLQSTSLFLKWCVQQDYIKENPCDKIPKPKLPKTIPKHLTADEAERVMVWTINYPYGFKYEGARAVGIMGTFLYTGIRKGELMNLKMEDIDIQDRTLYVRNGKCAKDRLIPLHSTLIVYLEQYLKERKQMKKCCPYFFTSLRQDTQMGEPVIKRLFDKIQKKSKIKFYPHLLRHTFATLMLEGGCNLYALSRMMGHSDIKTTTIYLGATKSHLEDQIGKHPMSI